MIRRALRPTSFALAAILAACTSPSSSSPGAPSGSPLAATSAAVSAPPASSPPAASGVPALPSADPLPLRASAPTAAASAPAPAAAGAPRPRDIRDAGAKDAGGAPAARAVTDGGAASPGQKIAQQVDAIFAGKKTFTARFKQQYTPRYATSVKDSSGVVFVERPSKISFRYDPPSKNRIVSDGTTIKVYIAEDEQMFETPVQKTEYPGALAFVMGNGIASSFDFAVNERARYEGVVLDGKPLTPNPSYETVMFFIDRTMLAAGDPGVIRRVLILDVQGNKNRFDFDGAAQPATIDPAEFTFVPPPGTTTKR